MKIDELLKKDKIDNLVIAFPTDTVYGVGCLINDQKSIERIYALKERDYNKPLAILVGSVEQAISLVKFIPDNAIDLIEKNWPGALTIICGKSKNVPSFLNPTFNTIGIRMPNSKIALAILKKYGPMAVTSVNKSGEPALNSYKEIMDNYHDLIDCIIESNEVSSNVSSTVIEVTDDYIRLVRQGDVYI